MLSAGGAEVGELTDNIEFVVVNGDDMRCLSMLSHYVRLLQTDGQSEYFAGLRGAIQQTLSSSCCVWQLLHHQQTALEAGILLNWR